MDVGCQDLGEQQLKNIARHVRVYRLDVEQPLSAIASSRGQLVESAIAFRSAIVLSMAMARFRAFAALGNSQDAVARRVDHASAMLIDHW
jgi:hypothetical protein